jgi:hypothetical protein
MSFSRLRQRSHILFLFSQLFLFLTILLSTSIVNAWDNCPFGEVNEPYPGTCGRYIDTDNDNICDLSQPSPDNRNSPEDKQNNDEQAEKNITAVKSKSTSPGIKYNFLPIAISLLIFYIITFSLSRKKKIKVSQHRKIWNVILLITFLISGIFGLILAILISYGIRLSFYSDLLFWHVEMGIMMAIISIFHITWHWKYYKRIFISRK